MLVQHTVGIHEGLGSAASLFLSSAGAWMRFYVIYVFTKKVVEVKPITENNEFMTPVTSLSEN